MPIQRYNPLFLPDGLIPADALVQGDTIEIWYVGFHRFVTSQNADIIPSDQYYELLEQFMVIQFEFLNCYQI